MKLAIRGICGKIEMGCTFLDDRFTNVIRDIMLASPRFDWKGRRGELLRKQKRWKFGSPPAGDTYVAGVKSGRFCNGDQR